MMLRGQIILAMTVLAVSVMLSSYAWRQPARDEVRTLVSPRIAGPSDFTSAPVATNSLECAPGNSSVDWPQLVSATPTVERDAALADHLERLARAQPDSAAALLQSLADDDRRRVVVALLLLARQPADAAQLAHQFCAADPTGEIEHGHALISVLARAGEFEAALGFVEAKSVEHGESENPTKWLTTLCAAWAKQSPVLAADRALALRDIAAREEAARAVFTVWMAQDAPAAERYLALRQAP